jgi:hypothetical protein
MQSPIFDLNRSAPVPFAYPATRRDVRDPAVFPPRTPTPEREALP